MYSDDVADQLNDPFESLYRLLSFTARDLRASLQDAFRSRGMTGAQFGVLLGASGGGSIGEIADQLLTDPTSVGRMVERMEEQGLVERYRIAPDRRVVWVRLQPRGEALLQELLPLHVHRTRALLSFLGEERRTVLVEILDAIRDHVAAAASSPGSSK